MLWLSFDRRKECTILLLAAMAVDSPRIGTSSTDLFRDYVEIAIFPRKMAIHVAADNSVDNPSMGAYLLSSEGQTDIRAYCVYATDEHYAQLSLGGGPWRRLGYVRDYVPFNEVLAYHFGPLADWDAGSIALMQLCVL